MEKFDFLIIGGGIFGCYAALYLAGKGAKILLVEQDSELMRRASVVNQARLHAGYHYPRSIATARLSDEYRQRFLDDHRAFVNTSFRHFYAIDRYNSLTDARQFERFCEFLKLPFQKTECPDFLQKERLEAVYLTEEFSFDPLQIAAFYRSKINEEKSIFLKLRHRIISANRSADSYACALKNLETDDTATIVASAVINATYAGTNGVLQLFGLPEIPLFYEISEMVFLKIPSLQNEGLTVMDGPFCSLMPYGLSGLHSLSSVVYTHHEVSKNGMPVFSCQQKNPACRPAHPADCNQCLAVPGSHFSKMEKQLKHYLSPDVAAQYVHSRFTIKAKLAASQIDDGRPTEITRIHENPSFYCIFAGKINSIYEIEKFV